MKYVKMLPVVVCFIMLVSCNNERAGEKNGTVDTQYDSTTLPHMDTNNRGFVDTSKAATNRADSNNRQ